MTHNLTVEKSETKISFTSRFFIDLLEVVKVAAVWSSISLLHNSCLGVDILISTPHLQDKYFLLQQVHLIRWHNIFPPFQANKLCMHVQCFICCIRRFIVWTHGHSSSFIIMLCNYLILMINNLYYICSIVI